MTIYKSKNSTAIQELLIQLGSTEDASLEEAVKNSLYDLVSEDCESIIGHIKNLELEAENMAQYIADMKHRKDGVEFHIETLKEALKRYILTIGERKVSFAEGSASLRKSTSVWVTDELPAEWFREKVDLIPDKARVKEALLAGAIVPGAELIQSENLVVK